jgi:uncharacterized 2Fe-2S/4Fe-4S cluster protein (DUF4445 family)
VDAADATTCTVDFEPVGRRASVPRGATLLDAARAGGVAIVSVCGGQGLCGRCRVRVLEGEVLPPGERDRHFISAADLTAGMRLACQTHVLGDVKVHLPKESLASSQRLQLEGVGGELEIDPAIATHALQMPPPSLEDPRSDLERLTDALGTGEGQEPWTAEPAVVRALSPLARHAGWRLSAYTRGREIVGVAAPGDRALGFACDLGTTKVAGYLVDLETGATLATAGVMNPQIGYGEDVISRLARASQDAEGGRQLARVVHEALDGLIGTLTASAGVARDQVAEACIVGNTAMTHLLLELPVHQLAVAPFVAAASAALDVKARDLGLEMAAGAYVHVLPCVRGFIGADHVAMILASGLDATTGVAIGVDIGTNTEIVLTRPDHGWHLGRHPPLLTAASCASGPAFEGAHISHGMRAATGAIEAVRIDGARVQAKTIGDAAPVGLCGSGIVDALAEMNRTGAINRRGRLVPGHPGVRQTEQGLAFVVVPAAESGTGREILVTQRDIGEIQLAKGAVSAGMESLVEATGTRREDIREVVIAGAFGSYLSLDSALGIGLLPRFPNARYVQVGNAAGAGARMALLSLRRRRRASAIARRMGYVELTTFAGFSRRFAEAMSFPQPQPHEAA